MKSISILDKLKIATFKKLTNNYYGVRQFENPAIFVYNLVIQTYLESFKKNSSWGSRLLVRDYIYGSLSNQLSLASIPSLSRTKVIKMLNEVFDTAIKIAALELALKNKKYKKSEMTEWVPSNKVPKHKGVYRIDFTGTFMWARYDDAWCSPHDSIAYAAYSNVLMMPADFKYCGLNNKSFI